MDIYSLFFFFFQAEDGIRALLVTGVQTCALPISAGLRDEDEPDAHGVDLWACNVQPWRAWCDLQTQWRVGMGGATGLDYAAALAVLRAVHGLRGEALRDTFDLVRAAELV